MELYKRVILQGVLDRLFDPAQGKTVMDWLTANEGRRRVVMVGAGFSRNAIVRSGKRPGDVIPLWGDVTRAMEADLQTKAGAYDPLTLADLYEARLGRSALQERMVQLLDDEDLEPGEAHKALLDSDSHAIVTTNFLDTLLDRYAPKRWNRVVSDIDLSKASIIDERNPREELIYFHGHRNHSDSWVASRCDYDDIVRTRPLIVARVRQLFAQYPLLVVGYSLSDPDFHALYRETARNMSLRHPLGLAVLPGEPESGMALYWSRMGLRLAWFKSGTTLGDSLATFIRMAKYRVSINAAMEQIREWQQS